MSTEVQDAPVEDDLGAAAAAGLGGDVDQPTLDGKAAQKGPIVKFNGVKATDVDEDQVAGWQVGQRVTFRGSGVVIHSGEELDTRDDTIRKAITIKIDGTHVEAD